MSSLFEQTFRTNPYPSCIVHRETLRFLSVNDAWAKTYGYRRDKLECMTMLDLYPASECSAAKQMLVRYGRTRRKSFITDQQAHTGRRVTMLLSSLPVDYEGQPAIYVTGEEVTKRVTTAQRLRQRDHEHDHAAELSRRLTSNANEAHLLESLVDAVSDLMAQADAAAIWLFDEERQTLVCRAASAMHGDSVVGERVDVSDVAESSGDMRERLHRIMSEHRLDIIRDTTSVAGFNSILPEPVARTRSRIAAPLLCDEHSIGFLAAYNYADTNVFSRSDERLMRLFGTLAATALRNVALVEEVRAISRRLMEAQETERRRLAHDLHDHIGGLLTSLRLSLRMNPAQREDARAELREAEGLAEELIMHVRQMSFRLRPSMLDDFGLIPTLEWYGTRYSTLTNIEVNFKHNVPSDTRYAPEIETGVFRVVQEALTNVARHAGVDEVQVLLFEEESELEVHVIDHGRGFAMGEQKGPRESMGLVGMTERILLLGGRITIDSAPGSGTRVTAALPVE